MDARAQHTTGSDAPESAVEFGEYVIRAPLSRRARADVFAGEHVPTGAPRLVYVLREPVMQDHPFVHQVVCEVDAARWLRHSAIAKLDGYGDTPSGRMYVAVERPGGRPLAEALSRGKPMVPRRLVRFANLLVEALEEAHAVGLVHGRLTPAIVHVADGEDVGGTPNITLIGLGTQAIALDGEVTLAERPYVSPEQLDGRAPDVKSDVFGLASLLHHVLLGAPPGEAGAPVPEDAPAELKPALEVLAVARSKEALLRPATVKAFWVDLLSALVDAPATEAAPAAAVQEPALAPIAPMLGLQTMVGRPLPPPAPPLAAVPTAPGFLPTHPVPAHPSSHPLETRLPVSRRTPLPVNPWEQEPPRRERQTAWDRPQPFAAEPERASVGGSGRARAAFIYLFWLIVPAAAFAAGWPAGFRGSPPAYTPHHIVIPPPDTMLPLLASPESAGVRARTAGSRSAPAADDTMPPAPPVVVKPVNPRIDVPDVKLPTFSQPLVTPEEFARRAKRDSLR